MEGEGTEAKEKKYLFCWDDVPKNESECKRLRRFLRYDLDIGWAGDAKPIESDDGMSISIEKKDEHSVKITMDKKEKKATLEISDGRTYELKVKKENGKRYIYKKKKAYVLISEKPKYAEEFCIMMVACKGLCDRASESKKLAEIDEVFSVFGPYDFLLELSGVGENEEERDKKINRTIFKIRETLGGYIYETCTLTEFDLSRFLGDDAKKCLRKAELFKGYVEPYKFKDFVEKLKTGDISNFDIAKQETATNKILTKDVHVLTKVKPECTEEFFVEMTLFKTVCTNRAPPSENLAKIDEVCSLVGQFDFLLKISGEEEKIIKTLLEIRETLGGYINATLTIEKFKMPMIKEELEKHFEKILREKSLAKLPGRDGEKVPKESHKPDAEIDLKEIYDAETTSLKSLLKKAKTFWEPEDLKKRIDDLEKQIEELKEKRS